MRARTVLAVTAGVFGSLDTSVNIAFPDIADAFDLAIADLQWIVITYVLTYGALLVAAGRVGDSFGHQRVLRLGALISVVGLAGCAGAPGFGLFLAARVVQGVGAALVMAGAPALLTTSARPTGGETGRAIGLFQTAAMIGLAIGPVIGAPLIEVANWRAVYWFRLPIAALLLVLTARRESSGQEPSDDRVDVPELVVGAATLGAAVAVLSLGRTWGWTDWRLLLLVIVTTLLATMFTRLNRASEYPLIDRGLARRPGFVRANTLTTIANGAMFPTWLLVPALLVDEVGLALLAAGAILAVSPAASSLASSYAGRAIALGRRRRLLIGGLTVEGAGMAIVGLAGASGSTVGVVVGLGLVGLGLGLFTVPNMHEVMSALPVERQGVAGGLSLMMRTLGIVAGVAIASTAFDPLEEAHGFASGFRWVFLGAAALLFVAAAAARVSDSAP